MKHARRLVLVLFAALAASAFLVSAASADTLWQNGVAVPVGSPVDFTSTNATFTGALPGPVTCTDSTLNTIVTQNGVLGAPVVHDIMNWTFTGCTMNGMPCTVTVNGLPWGNAMTLAGGPPQTVTISMPPNGSITIVCGASDCTYVGAGISPPQSLTGTWDDSPAPGTPASLTFTKATLSLIAPSTPDCGSTAALDATYNTLGTDYKLTAP